MKKKYISLYLLLLVLGILTQGCLKNQTKQTNLDNDNGIISYEQYRKLFSDLSENFLPKDCVKLTATENLHLVIVDKDNSFGKRGFLTLDGEQSDTSTQQSICYESINKEYILYIELIYLNKELDNDLVYWHSNFADGFIDESLAKMYDENILSFHNILVKMTLLRKSDSSTSTFEFFRLTTLDMVDFLSNYEFS
ncbi:MAG TPA: hypothetical protein GX002_06155 [Clostridiales bacterium]|nr:hypothetical protein [Clostridiales bacterium]